MSISSTGPNINEYLHHRTLATQFQGSKAHSKMSVTMKFWCCSDIYTFALSRYSCLNNLKAALFSGKWKERLISPSVPRTLFISKVHIRDKTTCRSSSSMQLEFSKNINDKALHHPSPFSNKIKQIEYDFKGQQKRHNHKIK